MSLLIARGGLEAAGPDQRGIELYVVARKCLPIAAHPVTRRFHSLLSVDEADPLAAGGEQPFGRCARANQIAGNDGGERPLGIVAIDQNDALILKGRRHFDHAGDDGAVDIADHRQLAHAFDDAGLYLGIAVTDLETHIDTEMRCLFTCAFIGKSHPGIGRNLVGDEDDHRLLFGDGTVVAAHEPVAELFDRVVHAAARNLGQLCSRASVEHKGDRCLRNASLCSDVHHGRTAATSAIFAFGHICWRLLAAGVEINDRS